MSAPEAAKAAGAAAATTEAPSLLDQVVAATRPQSDKEKERAKDYFGQFLSQVVKPGQVVSKDVEANMKHWIAEIDKKLSAQLNEVMHHADFQRLEATWRGLHYLIMQSETGEALKIRVLNVSKRDLFKDLEKAVEFDQSALFKKVYEEEYGQLGGSPYGMLLGDYDFSRHREDISLLKMISNVAAAAHAPFVSAANPKLFNMDRFKPAAVAAQVPAMKELLDMRQRLTQLMSKMEGNDKLEALLGEVMGNTEKAAALAKEMGIGGEEKPAEAPKEEPKA